MLRPFVLCVSTLAASVAVLGCGGCGGSASKPVVVDGSSTVYPISLAAQEAYTNSVEGTPRIIVDYHGTGGGFGRYAEGEVDIVDASRPAKPEEEEKARASGFEWTRYVVAHDGITVAVNPENAFVDALTVGQLRSLFEPGSAVDSWDDLDPSWPDEPISLYTPDDDSGTYEFFVKDALGMDGQREDVQPSADDNVLVSGIAGDAGAIGYFGFAYYAANRDKLRAVPIKADADAEPVSPSVETIYDGSYAPLSRPLFIYVKDAAMGRPEVADFVAYYLENVADLAEEAGYVSPTEDERAENLDGLSRAKGGTPAPAAAE
ncbi:PstS family phosphate ABC transporter substrate-binding protein [Tautonia plasticadhaerens]|uniref:Phosphate-binding protein n=1 Tax=Tautonia plasticadhaerens TaxID=2527974 RepID=A0A518HBM8_9BACT|nr:PstS family phosphate ABC transporter substrate-binding protein [Tautonia plasticadhaerens]QDV38252.1 Phosphate-binding protein PstS precursor [Tautonia plasticadhaerens]